MPTVPDMPGPSRLFFYSFDCHEPHVQVRREPMVCKFWLTPVALSVNHGFSPRELNRMRARFRTAHPEAARPGPEAFSDAYSPFERALEVLADRVLDAVKDSKLPL
jgi:hypothetical protein